MKNIVRKRIHQIVLGVLSVALLFAVRPVLAYAATASYLNPTVSGNGVVTFATATTTSAEVISEQTTWGTTGGTSWYVVSNTVTISDRITVTGDVYLILANNCTLTASAGITVEGENSLTIYAQSTDEDTMGKLVATAASVGSGSSGTNAGIGGIVGTSAGTITINGGIVTATGGSCSQPKSGTGAGIGGGGTFSYDVGSGGTITVNGGIVTATGGYAAYASGGTGAGIGGGGIYSGTAGSGGNITINGGTITSTGGYTQSGGAGAGIGGGGAGDGVTGCVAGSGGTVIITGGTVTAVCAGYYSGAGIGSGGRLNIYTPSVSGTVFIPDYMEYGTSTSSTFTAGMGTTIVDFPTDTTIIVQLITLTITSQPSNVSVGYSSSSISLSAEATAGNATIAYQWYSCDSDGSNAVSIGGANDTTYNPFLDVGTYYYYCVASCVLNNENVTATSDIATVTINKVDQSAPTGAVTVTSTYNTSNGNYDIAITSHTNDTDSTYEYAFKIGTGDVGNYSSSNTTTVSADDTTVVAYVRIAETDIYNASEPISNSVTTGTDVAETAISAAINTAMGLIKGNTFNNLANTVTTETDAISAIKDQIADIDDIGLTGIIVTVNTGTDGFTAATAGNYADNDGTEGSYTFTVTLTATNFSAVAGVTSESNTVEIAAVEAVRLTDTVELSGEVIYNSLLTANVTPDNGTGTYTYAWYRSGTTEAIQIGTSNTYTLITADIGNTITVKVNTTDQANQVTATSTTVGKATATLSNLLISGWTYGDTPNNPTVTAVTDGTVYYSYSTSKDGTYNIEEMTSTSDAGTYWVKAFVDETTNYTSAESEAASFTISIGDSTTSSSVDKTDATYTYGETITLIAEVGVAAMSNFTLGAEVTANYVGFYVGDTFLGQAVVKDGEGNNTTGAGTATFEYDTTEQGLSIDDNVITAYYGGSVNLNGSESNTITITLKKLAVTAEVVETDITKTYDGTGDVSVTFTVPEVTNSGDAVTVTADAAYHTVDVAESITINLTNQANGGADVAFYDVSLPDVTGDITQAEYTGATTATDSTKYGNSGAVSLSAWTELDGYSFTIGDVTDDNNILVEDSCSISDDTLVFTLVNDVTKVDEEATIEIIVSSTNYEDFTVNIVVKVMDLDVQNTLSFTNSNTLVYGEPLALSVTGGTGDGTVTYTVTDGTGSATVKDSILTPETTGYVTITATKDGGTNYNDVTASMTIFILNSSTDTIYEATVTGDATLTNVGLEGKEYKVYVMTTITEADNAKFTVPSGYTEGETFYLYTVVDGVVVSNVIFSNAITVTINSETLSNRTYQVLHYMQDGTVETITATAGVSEQKLSFAVGELSPFMVISQPISSSSDSTDTTSSSTENTNTESPPTGDSTYILYWAMLLCISAIGLFVLFRTERKKQ